MIKKTIAAVIALSALNASAESEWKYEVTPYLWAVALNGETGNGSVGAELDAGFDDVLSNLDMAALATFTAENERWGIKTDVVYMDVSTDAEVLDSKINVDSQQTVVSAGLFFKPSSLEALQIHGGLRYVDLDTGIEVKGPVLPTLNRELGDSWTEGYIGLQYTADLTESLALKLYGDVGGFSGKSDNMYQVAAIADYAINDTLSLKGGYRLFKIDYQEKDFVYDVKTDGLFVGLGIKF